MARICVVTQNPAWGGGVLTKLIAFLRYAASRGHRCDLYFPASDANANYSGLRKSSAVDEIFPVPWFEKLPDCVRSANFARNCRFARGYDAYQLVAGGLHQGLALVRNNVEFVAWIAATYRSDVDAAPSSSIKHRLLYNPLTKFLSERQEKICAGRARIIAPVSSYSKSELVRGYGVSPNKVIVLPVPVEMPSEIDARSERGKPYILSVGQLQRRKDFPTLLSAFAEVKRAFPDIELRIVGQGKELPHLVAHAARLGIAESTQFLGFLDDRELAAQYRHAAAFSLASRQEGLGIVFIEAMSYGLPVVATDCGGSADPVVHGSTGFLSPVGDPGGLARNLITLLSDNGTRAKMAIAARQRALERYSFDHVFATMDRIYEETFGL